MPRASTEPSIPVLQVRGLAVILDAELARLYDATTKRLNKQYKRNAGRFPEDFRFQLTVNEKAEAVANCDHLQSLNEWER